MKYTEFRLVLLRLECCVSSLARMLGIATGRGSPGLHAHREIATPAFNSRNLRPWPSASRRSASFTDILSRRTPFLPRRRSSRNSCSLYIIDFEARVMRSGETGQTRQVCHPAAHEFSLPRELPGATREQPPDGISRSILLGVSGFSPGPFTSRTARRKRLACTFHRVACCSWLF
jgi:hypothetical protein